MVIRQLPVQAELLFDLPALFNHLLIDFGFRKGQAPLDGLLLGEILIDERVEHPPAVLGSYRIAAAQTRHHARERRELR